MGRIRSIKPEFPQSESIGRLTRDARLTFILLWTLADDSGRLRGNSRMLASLLFPYDDDAKDKIEGWLLELEKEDCIVRYEANGFCYAEICNWLKHQKIDKPSLSKIPSFDEASANTPRTVGEDSSGDQGSRRGSGIKDQGSKETPSAAKPKRGEVNGFSPDVKEIIQSLLPIWHKTQPDGGKINNSVGKLGTNLSKIFKARPGLQIDLVIEGAKIYLSEKYKFYKAIQYFFGPEGPWEGYADQALERRNQAAEAEVAG